MTSNLLPFLAMAFLFNGINQRQLKILLMMGNLKKKINLSS